MCGAWAARPGRGLAELATSNHHQRPVLLTFSTRPHGKSDLENPRIYWVCVSRKSRGFCIHPRFGRRIPVRGLTIEGLPVTQGSRLTRSQQRKRHEGRQSRARHRARSTGREAEVSPDRSASPAAGATRPRPRVTTAQGSAAPAAARPTTPASLPTIPGITPRAISAGTPCRSGARASRSTARAAASGSTVWGCGAAQSSASAVWPEAGDRAPQGRGRHRVRVQARPQAQVPDVPGQHPTLAQRPGGVEANPVLLAQMLPKCSGGISPPLSRFGR